MSRVVVIGGGAAGMMAAYGAASSGHEVTLIEKNEKLGKKLYITGKGRGNVTNACEPQDFFKNVVSNPKFLYSSLYGFDQNAVMDLLEQYGCPLKVERGNRVFPVSDHASDITRALQKALETYAVDIRLNTKAEGIRIREGQVTGVVLDRKKGKGLEADACIVATGGLSYPSTGSTGDGFVFAREAGHEITACKPALVPFEIKENWCHELQGLSLKNVEIHLFCDGKQRFHEQGEMLFTHFGVSGPLILSASSVYAAFETGKEVWLELDLKPALDEDILDKRLIRELTENGQKSFENAVRGLFPGKMTSVMVEISGIPGDKKAGSITAEERKHFGHLIKHLRMNIKGTRGYNEAIITHGGVKTDEINPSTMESKKIKGLYFAGEVLDLDAYTGGFNLQIAWSTGFAAGSGVSF